MTEFSRIMAQELRCTTIVAFPGYAVGKNDEDSSLNVAVGYDETGKQIIGYRQGEFSSVPERKEKDVKAVIGIHSDLFHESFLKTILRSRANLVILHIDPTLLAPPQTSRQPDLDVLSHMVRNLGPLDAGHTIDVVLACGYTSAVIRIQGRNVNVYGILGPYEEKPLVVDTTTQPTMKLIQDWKGSFLVHQSSTGNFWNEITVVPALPTLQHALGSWPLLDQYSESNFLFVPMTCEPNDGILKDIYRKLEKYHPHYLIIKRQVQGSETPHITLLGVDGGEGGEGSETPDVGLPRVYGGEGGVVYAYTPNLATALVDPEMAKFTLKSSCEEHYLYKIEHKEATTDFICIQSKRHPSQHAGQTADNVAFDGPRRPGSPKSKNLGEGNPPQQRSTGSDA